MKTLILTMLLLTASVCSAGEYRVEPLIPDVRANDGILDAGTTTNPYIVKDRSGRKVGEMRPWIRDVRPNDGVFDRGTYSNPYILDTE